MNDLAIIIPSYNRPEKLLNTLVNLYPQIVDGVKITVIDNCSDIFYQNYCTESDRNIANCVREGLIRFTRNKSNIGVAANLMRTFETCDSEWMWLLADDDMISQTAISDILNEIRFLENEKDVAFIKFSSRGCEAKKEGCFIKSLDGIIEILAISKVHFNSYIFTSNGVYRVPFFKDHLITGYQYLNTYVPHIMMLLNYLNKHENENVIYLSNKQIAFYVVPEMGYSYGFVAGLGVGAFKNFTFNISKINYLKLESVFFPHNDFKVALDLFYYARFHSNMFVARRLYSNYCVQSKPARNFIKRFMMKVFMLSFYFPEALDRIIGMVSSCSPMMNRHIMEIKKRNKIVDSLI